MDLNDYFGFRDDYGLGFGANEFSPSWGDIDLSEDDIDDDDHEVAHYLDLLDGGDRGGWLALSHT